MIRRLSSSLGGLGVVAISAAVFVVAFLSLQSISAAARPPEVELLAAARDLPAGATLTEEDLRIIRAFRDEASAAFVPAEEITRTVGGLLAMPVQAGSPILRDALLAPAGARFSALLADAPSHAAFPLFLDEPNIASPPIETFRPGDVVGILAVMAHEPARLETPAVPELPSVEPRSTPTATTVPPTATLPATVRIPVAKSLFPQGVRVLVALSPRADPELGVVSGRPALILLVPAGELERLALVLQQADKIFVVHLGRAEGLPERTPAFTFDDLIAQMEEDRRRLQTEGGRTEGQP
ncbi:SAF domain-containing protein [Thermoflexus sp.]|jgi:Flp pilus assembly protein CpaB|uniref:SAF domain-containing protein n=1 Tax=Thermoflexus sp. TaxID=1969742 RepID=UPI003C048ADE